MFWKEVKICHPLKEMEMSFIQYKFYKDFLKNDHEVKNWVTVSEKFVVCKKFKRNFLRFS